MKYAKFVIFFISIFIFKSIYSEYELVVLTENFPPYNYEQNGYVEGISSEIVRLVLDDSKVNYKITAMPWTRAYALTQSQPNTLLFSTSRSAKREKLFKWIGPIAPKKYSVFALKSRSDIEINSLEDMKKYRIGTTQNDARESYLIEKGFKIGDQLDSLADESPNESNFKKLRINRIDLWPMPDAVAHYIVKKAGYEPDEIINRVYVLDDLSKDGYYIAVNKETDETIVNNLQKSLDKLRRNGKQQAILQKWGLSE
jgi:polar amino acid transport system substrate-binding protein